MTVIAKINTRALQHNLACVQRLAPQSKVLAMVKANAYGHGLIEVAEALAEADALGVARLEEARTLREKFPARRIVIFSEQCTEALLQDCAAASFELVLHQFIDVTTLCNAHLSAPLGIWLKLDTGMHRLGLLCKQADSLRETIDQAVASRSTRHIVLLSHLASAEADAENTEAQITLLTDLTKKLSCERSLANSAAIMHNPASHFDWVRPGIMLYGASPYVADKTNGGLHPVMTLTAPLIAVRTIKRGERVGYNGVWQAQRDSVIGTIGIGYGDGYPRHARNGTPVIVNGQRAPLAGRVSMDMITVDLTDHPRYAVGDSVELWGEQLPANEVAQCATTIAYDLFTAVSRRVELEYR